MTTHIECVIPRLMKVATLVYLRKDNKTLMMHRVKKENDMHKDKWNGLGGKVENGESPEECAIREVKEETNLDIKKPILKGILTFPNNIATGETWYVFVYTAYDFEGEILEDKDAREGKLEWISNDKLLNLPIWEGDKLFIPLLDKHGIFSAKFRYSGDELVQKDIHIYN